MATTAEQPAVPSNLDTIQRILKLLRGAVLSTLLVAAVLFAVVALFPLLRGGGLKPNWQYPTWGGLMALVCLAGAGLALTQTKPTLMETLEALRRITAYTLLALAAGFAAVPIFLLARSGSSVAFSAVFLWSAALASLFLVIGLLLLTDVDWGGVSAVDRFRLTLMTLGGLAGLITVLLGFALPLTVYREVLSEGLQSWRQNPLALVLPGGALLGGLVLMFLSLQLGRDMERSSASVRRLIYGYNAVLTVLLLVSVLALVNVLAYAAPFTRVFGRTFDWTSTGFNSLSPQTRNLMAELKEPVKVYVLLPRSGPVAVDVQAMLEACRNLTNKLSWELIDVRSIDNRARLLELQQKYSLPADPRGLLVVAGTEPKTDHEFIRVNDLFDNATQRPGQPARYVFKGEPALFNAVDYLSEGKTKVVVYFTQGSGEPDLGEGPGTPGREASLRTVKNRLLERKSFEVKALRLSPTTKKVPDDANVVVIVRPTQAIPAQAVSALREYVQAKKGKLMALLDPVVLVEGGSKRLLQTGLEPLLASYGIQLGNDRVLNLAAANPLRVQAVANPESTAPIARAFIQARSLTLFAFEDVRTVEALKDTRAYNVQPLILALPQQGIWAEKDFNKDPTQLVADLRKDEAAAEKKLSAEPLSLAVTVAESGSAGMPHDLAHASVRKDRPLMVVFGSGSWVTDDALTGRAGQNGYDLFASCVSWLRERPTVGSGPPSRESELYDLNIQQDKQARLEFLPIGLTILAVIGLGTGVWVVRRR